MPLNVTHPKSGKQGDVVHTGLQQGDNNTNRVSSENDEELPYPSLAPVVCFGLRQTTRPRNWCLKVACGPWLFYVSLLMSLFTCVIQGMYKPCEGASFTLQVLDIFTFVYFVVEILVKTVALGLYGSNGSVLSNNWNKFDILIIFTEIVDYFLAVIGVKLQLFNAVKPMRLVGRVPSMKGLVLKLLETLPMLGNVLILYAFVIHVLAVVGVQLWSGQLLNRCFLGEDIVTKYNVTLSPYYESAPGERIPFICSTDKSNGLRRCTDVPPYHDDGKTCTLAAPHYFLRYLSPMQSVPTVARVTNNSCINWNMYYNVCREGDRNPNLGVTNFDNIAYAWITIFQVVTLKGWTDIMQFLMDSSSMWSFAYLIFVTIIGSTIIMNVCAVIIATHFAQTMERETTEHHAGALVLQNLWSRFKLWLRIFCNRVHNSDSKIEKDGLTGQSWISFQKKLKVIVISKLFNRLIMFAVFLNVLTMAIEHYDQPQELTTVLQNTMVFFTFLFLLEMIVKLMALSWMYFDDQDNIFDFIIVVISLLGMSYNSDSRLSIIRAFRVLRFGRLVHLLPYLRRQLLVLKRTVGKAATLCWLMLFFLFVFSILGMHLFGCKFSDHFEEGSGHIIFNRKNFDSLLWSMVTVFQVLTEEEWHLVLYKAMASTSAWAVLYFVAIIVLGKHVLLNVLVGIVVENYQSMPSDRSEQESSAPANSSPTGADPTHERSISMGREEETAPTDANKGNGSLSLIQKVLRRFKKYEDWSLYVFSPRNKCRVFCQCVSSHRTFDLVVLFFILINCVTIAMERPDIHPQSLERNFLNISSMVFSAVFLVEMIIKVVALGFVIGEESYCRSAWNVMDGVLVVLSVVHISIKHTSDTNHMLGILKVFRLLRTLRLLRVIKRTPRLKLAVEALIASVKPMGNIILISCIFFFFFGIFGVQLFKGTFHHCVGKDIKDINNKTSCLAANYSWVRREFNFDNLPQALMSLFVMYSKDGWVNIMYHGLDAVGVDQQPVKNYNEWMLLYFISFMIISFLLLDMFVGVMVDTFHQCQQVQRQKDASEGQTSQDQHAEPEQSPYYIHYSPVRLWIHTLCTSRFPEIINTLIIVLSVLIMAAEHYKQPQYIQMLTDYSHALFTIFLIIEVVLKVVAFGLVRFLKNRWNLMDVAVVLASVLSIVFSGTNMEDVIPIDPNILRVFRVLRLTQVLKAKMIRVLLKTIVKTLSQGGNISLLFMFFFFIFAVLGVELFGKLECSPAYPCEGLNRYINFRHFGMALLTLYKVCTGDNWSSVLKDMLRPCHPNNLGCSGYLFWAGPLYLIIFVIVAQFVLINLVVAAIMQALEDSSEEEELPATNDMEPDPDGSSQQHEGP